MNSINRRNFVKQAGAGATGLIASGPLIKGFTRESANETVNVAVMGIRSRGGALRCA